MNVLIFWDIVPCRPMWSDVVGERITIFTVENHLFALGAPVNQARKISEPYRVGAVPYLLPCEPYVTGIPAGYFLTDKRQVWHLVREGTRWGQDRICETVKNIWSSWGLTPWHTVSSNVTLAVTTESSTSKIEIRSFGTSVHIRTTPRYIPEDSSIHNCHINNYRCKNPKSYY
jgi:hypothetical protein